MRSESQGGMNMDNQMYSKEILTGILLSKARPNVRIFDDERLTNGYNSVPEINMGGNRFFLDSISKTLKQHGIHSKMRHQDKKYFKLRIGRLYDLLKITNMVLPYVGSEDWTWFKESLLIIEAKQHLTAYGCSRIMELKNGRNKHE